MDRCAVATVDECDDPPEGSIEVYVDKPFQGRNGLAKLTRAVAEKAEQVGYRGYVRVHLCRGHFEEAVKLFEQAIDNPDLWAPGMARPPIFPRNPHRGHSQ